MKKKIGIVIEYLEKKDKIFYAEENQKFIEFLKKNKVESYAINPIKEKIKRNSILAINIINESKEKIKLEEFKTIYFGRTGQKFIEKKISNSLGENLKKVCNFLEKLKEYEGKIKFVNPLNTIIWNFSKEYLIDFSKKGLPTIPTTNIENLNQLLELKNSKETWIVKPKISERANGTQIINKMSNKEIKKYYKKYTRKYKGNSLYKQILRKQGIIAQKFEDQFEKEGERKFFVVGGEFTLSRNTINEKKMEKHGIVSANKGAKMIRYTPSEKEKEICLNIYSQINSEGLLANFIRVDLIGGDGEYKINEIEIINPSSGSREKDVYTNEELDLHHKKIMEILNNEDNIHD